MNIPRNWGTVFSAGWFATGVFLTTTTQLRPSGGIPVGPGEAMLALWTLVALVLLLSRSSYSGLLLAKPVLGFWAVAFTLLFTGFVFSSAHVFAVHHVYHDALAFLFVALLFCVYASRQNVLEHMELSARFLLPLVVIPMLLLLLLHRLTVGPFMLWMGNELGVRFQGLSENPNQLALAVVAAPFVAFHFFTHARGLFQKGWYLLLAGAAVPLGMATKSDALAVGWTVSGVLVVLGLFAYSTTRTGHSAWKLWFFYIVVPAAAVMALGWLGGRGYAVISEKMTGIYNTGGQGSYRVLLWEHGIEAIAASPVFGHGPGAHSGHYGPFGQQEAHNTLIDWGASTGISGILLFLLFLGWAAYRAWRNGSVVLCVAVVALAGFSLLHYVVRHPIFWFYITAAVGLSLASQQATAAARGMRARRSGPNIPLGTPAPGRVPVLTAGRSLSPHVSSRN